MKTSSILLVEDNENDQILTERAFRKNNLANHLRCVSDGEEALDYLLGNEIHPPQELPDLILLDLKLPKISGLEVLRALRADSRTSLIPVVVLTSSREQEDLIRSYSLGANSYVRKPVDFLEFIKAVQQLGLYWLVLNETPTPPG